MEEVEGKDKRELHASVIEVLEETSFNWTIKQFYHIRASWIILEEILGVKLDKCF